MQKLLLDKLLAIIVLAGILAAVAIPVFLNQRQKGYDLASEAELKTIATAQASSPQVSRYQF